jgi:hypothetical protein
VALKNSKFFQLNFSQIKHLYKYSKPIKRKGAHGLSFLFCGQPFSEIANAARQISIAPTINPIKTRALFSSSPH